MAEMKYPVGVQSFSEIREKGFVYVDKTSYIHRLITTGKYIFLSRPRRFGKSLLLSTIEAYFLGRRDLFEGLDIASHDNDWKKHPVFHIDLTGSNYNEPESLYNKLDDLLLNWENQFGIEAKIKEEFGIRFKNIIQKAHSATGEQVVILVDEYDKPLLETVDNPNLQSRYRNDLRAFYSNLKSQDPHIRFAMLTGVTKFGHLSIFSDLNNLNDISLLPRYAGICGITAEELDSYFMDSIKRLAEETGATFDETFSQLQKNYDGYHFSATGSPDVYNPYSLLSAFNNNLISEYWFSTGTPTFLIKMLKANLFPLQNLDGFKTDSSALTDISFDMGEPVPILYQSGYLTIKEYNPKRDSIKLGYPNREVENGFMKRLMSIYTPVSIASTKSKIDDFVDAVEDGDAESLMIGLQSLFSDFQYDSFDLHHLEQHYHDVIYIVLKLMGFYVRTEYKTASGRIDMLIKTDRFIYLFEFKMDKSAKEALDQINAKDYLLPFRADNREIIKIGANFSHKIRSISEWIIESESKL